MVTATISNSTMQQMESDWRGMWPQALASWSAYTQLREPVFFHSDTDCRSEGMAGEIAAIRLIDQVVLVNLSQVGQRGLADLSLPILAHEIGHHVYVPGNLTDNARMIAAIRPVLTGLAADTAHVVANLYGDLLINDRLHRREIGVVDVYRKFKQSIGSGESTQVWRVYTRAYEHLWHMPPGSLAPAGVTDEMNADAALVSRLVRHYASNWLRGVRRFTCILYPYLQADEEARKRQTFVVAGLCDTRGAGRCSGCGDGDVIPDGLSGIDPAELGEDDDFDRDLDDPIGGRRGDERDQSANRKGRRGRRPMPDQMNTAPSRSGKGTPTRQFREPFEYAEILRALGINVSDFEITTRYYRERALPHLIPFPTKRAPQSREPLAEGYATWEPTEDIEDLDVFGSIVRSPYIVPGVTTVQRVYGDAPGSDPARLPMDLDIYIDSSGSMPNPAVNMSYLALAGTILALSALRAGARVQATLWSGAGQFVTTDGFTRDEKRILGTITGYIAGATAFPLHVLRDTYATRKPTDPPAHVVVISDEGVDTILELDEKGAQGADICTRCLDAARGGGTLVLNLTARAWPPRTTLEQLGLRVHAVTDWSDLVAFARQFVRENYEERRP
jgi:hypothetical protein